MFVNARLYDEVPSLIKKEENSDSYSPIKGVKESDLLLISQEELIRSSYQDIKKVISP